MRLIYCDCLIGKDFEERRPCCWFRDGDSVKDTRDSAENVEVPFGREENG